MGASYIFAFQNSTHLFTWKLFLLWKRLCYTVVWNTVVFIVIRRRLFSLLHYYGTVTTLHYQLLQQRWHYWVKGTSHMQHHQGNPICHNIEGLTLQLCVLMVTLVYTRGGKLVQIQEPHIRRQHYITLHIHSIDPSNCHMALGYRTKSTQSIQDYIRYH
jgi:hypothetical protein